MYLLAGLGGMSHKTSTDRNTIVAAFMLYAFTYNVGVEAYTLLETYADGAFFRWVVPLYLIYSEQRSPILLSEKRLKH